MLTTQSKLPLFATISCFFAMGIPSSAMTGEELLALQKETMAKQVTLPTKATEYKKTERLSLFERSDILSNGRYWTYLPKHAILHIPDHLKSKVVSTPQGELVSWDKFFAMNPAWLSKESIDLATAKGSKSIDFERFTALKQRRKIVVAVSRNCPISVSSRSIQKEPKLASK